jgi:hypothetical protein
MLRRALARIGERYFGWRSGRQCFDAAIASLSAGDIPAAEAALKKTFKRLEAPPDFDIEFNAGIIRARGGRLIQAEQHLVEAMRLFPGSTHAAYALGSIRAIQGNIDGALEIFKADLPVMTGNGSNTYTRALYLDDTKGMTRSRTVEMGEISPLHTTRAVYLVVSDSVYFCRYAAALARSILLNGGGNIHLHFHVINPNAEVHGLVRALAPSVDVSVSTETIDIDDLNPEQRKTYYASARFLIIKDILVLVSKPLLVCDIDQLVLADIEPILRIGQGRDVALLRFDGQAHNILSMVSATAMLIMPTNGAALFCKFLEENILNAIAHPRRLTWHLDQAALAMTYLMLPSVKHGRIPLSAIHLADGEPAASRPSHVGILWSITNSIDSNMTKLETPMFKSLSVHERSIVQSE